MPGVSTIVVQGGQEPEFEVQADPAKLLQTQLTVPKILDAIGRGNLIDSPGLFENNHQLVLSLVSGQARTPDDIGGIVVKTTRARRADPDGDVAKISPSVKPVYTAVTANAKPAVLLNVFRQPDSNTVTVADAVHAEIETHPQGTAEGRRPAAVLRSVGPGQGFDHERARRHPLGLVLASLIMVLFLRDWGTSLVAGLVIPATLAVTFIALRCSVESFNLMTLGGLAAAVGLVIDDAIVVVENIVMHRDSGQSAGGGDPQRDRRDPRAAGRIHHHADRRVSAADLHHRRDRRLLPGARAHRRHGAAHLARARAHLDADAQPLFLGRGAQRRTSAE